MHFITNGYKRFSKTNSTDPRQRVPLREGDGVGGRGIGEREEAKLKISAENKVV